MSSQLRFIQEQAIDNSQQLFLQSEITQLKVVKFPAVETRWSNSVKSTLFYPQSQFYISSIIYHICWFFGFTLTRSPYLQEIYNFLQSVETLITGVCLILFGIFLLQFLQSASVKASSGRNCSQLHSTSRNLPKCLLQIGVGNSSNVFHFLASTCNPFEVKIYPRISIFLVKT